MYPLLTKKCLFNLRYERWTYRVTKESNQLSGIHIKIVGLSVHTVAITIAIAAVLIMTARVQKRASFGYILHSIKKRYATSTIASCKVQRAVSGRRLKVASERLLHWHAFPQEGKGEVGGLRAHQSPAPRISYSENGRHASPHAFLSRYDFLSSFDRLPLSLD